MTMNVSLRNRPSTDTTATGTVAQPQPNATPAIQQSTGRQGADVVEVAATSLGAAGCALVTPLLVLDTVILSVLQMAYRLNNGTLPPSHTIQHMMREEAPQLLAATQHRVEQQLERQFASGADAGAHGQPPPANSSPAFRRGYDAGLQYRQAHGCELEEYEQQRRILDAVTRGTSRDPSVGIRALVVGPERPAGIVSAESLADIVRGE